MRRAITLRRLFYALVGVGFVLANPLHLPFTLPWLIRQWEGNAVGAFLGRYEATILVTSTAYFMLAMTSFYLWLWTRRRRRPAPAARVQPPAAERAREGPAARYRGPGGGRTPPRRRRVRR